MVDEESDKFLSFNYTLTLEEVYNIKNVYHIHGVIGEELLIGHTSAPLFENGQDGKYIGSEHGLEMIHNILRKDIEGALKKNIDFFEDLGKRLGETAEAVTNKAGEAVEVQRLRSQIRSLEKENEKDLAEIGRMIYRQYQKKESVDAEAEAYCEAIESREESIREYRRKIIRVRGGVKCNVCGRMVAKDMIFCPYCGEKLGGGEGE